MVRDPGTRTIGVLILLAVIGTALVVWLLSDVLLMVFGAILVAIAYRSWAEWLHRETGLPVGWGLLLTGLSLGAGVIAILWWMGGTLAGQAGDLWQLLQERVANLRDLLHGTPWGQRIVDYITSGRFSGPEALVGRFAGAAVTTIGVLGSLLIIFATAIYFAIDPGLYRRGLIRLLPHAYRQRAREVLGQVGDALRLWLVGRAVDMLVVIGLTYAGLALIDVPLAFLLALIAGLLNFIPYIGAIGGAVPAILVALGQGTGQALWVTLLFVVIQMVEGYFLAPFIQERTVQLPPAMTILSQTVFGTLFGLMGLLLAPALMVVLMVLVQAVYIHDVLGDRKVSQPGAGE